MLFIALFSQPEYKNPKTKGVEVRVASCAITDYDPLARCSLLIPRTLGTPGFM